jgi:hypothetical protein
MADNGRPIADYHQAIQLDPSNASFYYARGYVRRAKGDKKGGSAGVALAKKMVPGIGGHDDP